MNNDTNPKTPSSSPEPPVEDQDAALFSIENSEIVSDQTSPDPNTQWQTKEDYKASQEVATPVQSDMTGINKVYKWTAIILGVSVIVLLLSMLTPIGNSIVIQPGPEVSRGGPAYPLIALSIIAVGTSYITFIAVGITKAQRQRKSKAAYIVLLVIGVALFANPLGAIILLFAITCNLSPCSGT